MANVDIVQKIQDLQAEVNGSLLSRYQEAKKWVDDATKRMEEISKLPKLSTSQFKEFQQIESLMPQVQELAKNLQKPAQQTEKAQTSIDELMRVLQSRLPNMGQATRSQYASMSPDFLTASDPAAQETFKKFVSTLQTVPTENIRGELRQYVQKQLKAGAEVTATEFAQKQQELAQGNTFGPDENPDIQRDLRSASRRGLSRVFNRDNFSVKNFRDHMSSGGFTSLGYDALALAQGGVGVADTYLDGRRYTQEARERALYGLLPGVGGLVGTGIGAFAGNPIAGGFIGAAVGSAADGVLSAKSERSESIRLAAEEIALQMGRGTVAAGKFADLISDTASRLNVPAQELAQSSAMIARSVTGFGSGGVTLQARLAQSLGDNYSQFAPAQLQFAATPFSRPYRSMLTGSTAPNADLYGDAAFYDAFTGDQAGYKSQLAMKRAIAPPRDYQQYVADKQAAKPMDWWTATKETALSVLEGAPSSAIIEQRAAQRRVADFEQQKQKTILSVARAGQTDEQFYGSVYEDARRGRETFGLGEAYAAIPRIGTEMAQQSGQGLAGMRRFAPAEISALRTEQQGLASQAGILTNRLSDRTLTGDRRTAMNLLLAQVYGQQASVNAQVQQVPIRLFREGVEEHQAQFASDYGLADIFGQALTLGGASSLSPGVARSYAQRRAYLSGQSAYDLGLAGDATNFLSPQERAGLRLSAGQADFQANFALPNQFAVQRIGDTQAGSGLRQSGLRAEVTRQQVAGGYLGSLEAQNRLIREQESLQAQLGQRLMEGNLSYQQRTQLASQIRDLEAQTLSARKSALDTAVQGVADMGAARYSIGSSQASREVRLRGTSTNSYALAQEGYQGGMQNVAALKLAADIEANPDLKIQKQAAYQRALEGTEQQGIDSMSQVAMSPDFRRQQTLLEHQLRRQQMSPFEGGSVIGTNSKLAGMSRQEIAAYDAQIQRVMRDPTKTEAEKRAAFATLTAGKEEVRDQQFSYQQSVDVGWIDRLVSMSVNAPSFAARLMPGSDRVADIAEKRGLGRMSARVFGYGRQQSYRDTMDLGTLPSETSRFAFGMRPGDDPFVGMIGDAAVTGGAGMTLGSIEGGGTGAGVMMQAAQMLLQAAQVIAATAGKPQQVTVTQINPTTGQAASQTQNSQSNYNVGAIMKGGASSMPGRSGY